MSGIRKLVRKVVDAVNVLCGNRRDDSMVKLIFNWTESYDRWEHEIHCGRYSPANIFRESQCVFYYPS